MRGHGAKLPRKQEEAIASLMTHRTIDEAAKSINISRNTLRRWMALPDFAEAYYAARREAVLHTNARIQQNSGPAAAVLLKLMADPTTPAGVRVRAAEKILDISNQSLEVEDMEQRITMLEATVKKGIRC